MFGLGVLAGVLAVVLLDSLGSIAVRGNTRRYAALAPLSHAIWLLAGGLAAWSQRSDPILAVALGAAAAGIVGFTDATVGWWISTALGATPMPSGHTWRLRVSRISLRVAARAAIVGAIGGALAAIA